MCYKLYTPNLFFVMCYEYLYICDMAAIYTPIRIPERVMEKIEADLRQKKQPNKSKIVISILKKHYKLK